MKPKIVIGKNDFYLDKYSRKYDKLGLKINQSGQSKLLSYKWPGNVRELQHSIEKAVILADHNILDENSFSLNTNSKNSQNASIANQNIEEVAKKQANAQVFIGKSILLTTDQKMENECSSYR